MLYLLSKYINLAMFYLQTDRCSTFLSYLYIKH